MPEPCDMPCWCSGRCRPPLIPEFPDAVWADDEADE